MAKKDNIIDIKPTTITDEQLKSLQTLVNSMNRQQMEIGSLETRKHQFIHQYGALQGQMQTMQTAFEEEYGKVDISLTDGTIKYTEDEQADKKD
tara:strand:+ start:283 stop:564 length:282 start_codon:yes stop_codon:yes gene_type:complete